jgi:hypothetical protein
VSRISIDLLQSVPRYWYDLFPYQEEEEEEEKPKKKVAAAAARKPALKKRAPSESGSEEEVPSDGGGSDYEPDEPVKVCVRTCALRSSWATAIAQKYWETCFRKLCMPNSVPDP